MGMMRRPHGPRGPVPGNAAGEEAVAEGVVDQLAGPEPQPPHDAGADLRRAGQVPLTVHGVERPANHVHRVDLPPLLGRAHGQVAQRRLPELRVHQVRLVEEGQPGHVGGVRKSSGSIGPAPPARADGRTAMPGPVPPGPGAARPAAVPGSRATMRSMSGRHWGRSSSICIALLLPAGPLYARGVPARAASPPAAWKKAGRPAAARSLKGLCLPEPFREAQSGCAHRVQNLSAPAYPGGRPKARRWPPGPHQGRDAGPKQSCLGR